MSNVPSSQSLLEAIFHLAADPMDTSNSDHLAALRKIAALADNAMRGRVDEDVHHDDVPLSNGELTLLELLVQGAANKVIARKLDIAEGTVKIRLLFLMRKLRVNNRTQAAIWAVQHGKCPRPQLLPPVGSEAA